jgi:hypothetical protein
MLGWGIFDWFQTNRPKAVPSSREQNVEMDAYQNLGFFIVSGKTNPLRREVSVCYSTVEEIATKASLSQARNL